MEHFSIGVLSFISAIIFPILYFTVFQLRRLGAWSKREEGPKDRIVFFLIVTALIGFTAGSLAQPLWNKGVECKAAGQSIIPCVFFAPGS